MALPKLGEEFRAGPEKRPLDYGSMASLVGLPNPKRESARVAAAMWGGADALVARPDG